MKKLSPVLIVEAIEPCLPFWVDRLKFQKTVDVPGDGGIQFCILQREGVEIMLQTQASVADDVPELAKDGFETSGVALFIEVDDLDDIISATKGCEIVVPDRTTFYGMRELGVRVPGGCCAVFAQKVAAEQQA